MILCDDGFVFVCILIVYVYLFTKWFLILLFHHLSFLKLLNICFYLSISFFLFCASRFTQHIYICTLKNASYITPCMHKNVMMFINILVIKHKVVNNTKNMGLELFILIPFFFMNSRYSYECKPNVLILSVTQHREHWNTWNLS